MGFRSARYLVSAFFMFFACSGGSQSAPKSTATPDDFCHTFVETVIELQTRCFGRGESFWRDLYSRFMTCDGLATDIANGRITYDKAKGTACLDQVRALACDSILDEAADACAGVLVGNVPSWGACGFYGLPVASSCAPGNRCIDEGNSCTGRCKPVANDGSSCAYSSSTGSVWCAVGSVCQLNTNLCVPNGAEGEPCDGPSAGYCRGNLVCEGSTGKIAGSCRQPKTSGPCKFSLDCAFPEYVCAGQEGATTCRKAKLPGDSCILGQGECYDYFSWCGSNGTCTDTGAQENEPCGEQVQGLTSSEEIQCAEGLTCVTGGVGAGTCRKQKPAGSPCTRGDECAGTESYCDSRTKLCVSCRIGP
jgi:hypothetical protein